MKNCICFGLCGFVVAGAVVGKTTLNVPEETTKKKPWRRIDQSAYVGSKKCAECHKEHYVDWKGSAHNKIIQPAVAKRPHRTIQADFSLKSPYRNFELKDGKWVIGHRWKQRSNFKLCAGCHSTGVDAYTESWVELNISCESCHGPGQTHSKKPLVSNIVNPSRLSRDRSIDICLSCHQSGKTAGTDYAWPVGYQPGMDLSKFWKGFESTEVKQMPEFWHNGNDRVELLASVFLAPATGQVGRQRKFRIGFGALRGLVLAT